MLIATCFPNEHKIDHLGRGFFLTRRLPITRYLLQLLRFPLPNEYVHGGTVVESLRSPSPFVCVPFPVRTDGRTSIDDHVSLMDVDVCCTEQCVFVQ